MANDSALVERALHSLHDPTRRRVLELLRTGEKSVREITDEMPVSQSAVSQHLKVLRDADLVRVRAEGTRRLYRVDAGGLGPVRAWVDSFWDAALEGFVDHVRERDATSQPGTEVTR